MFPMHCGAVQHHVVAGRINFRQILQQTCLLSTKLINCCVVELGRTLHNTTNSQVKVVVKYSNKPVCDHAPGSLFVEQQKGLAELPGCG